MDYWNRDTNGKAVRNTEFKNFTTRNGRKVQDGGGVLPEVEIASIKTNALTKSLIKNHVIFDFATDYFYKNKVDSPDNFKFTDADFKTFKNYVGKADFTFETETEKALMAALNSPDKDIFGAEVEENYRNLLVQINKSKINAVDKYKAEIQKNLEDEIVKRYFYRDGLYEYYLKNDTAILTATALLGSKSKYDGYLK